MMKRVIVFFVFVCLVAAFGFSQKRTGNIYGTPRDGWRTDMGRVYIILGVQYKRSNRLEKAEAKKVLAASLRLDDRQKDIARALEELEKEGGLFDETKGKRD